MAVAPRVWVQPVPCFGFAASWAVRMWVHLPYCCQGVWACVFSTEGELGGRMDMGSCGWAEKRSGTPPARRFHAQGVLTQKCECTHCSR